MEKCIKYVSTTAVSVTSRAIVLSIPKINLENCTTIYLCIAQEIPETTSPQDMIVAIDNGGETTNTVLTPCCANNLYADQLTSKRAYFFRYGADTACWIYKGGWRLCKTNHDFTVVAKKTVVKKVETTEKKSVKKESEVKS